jgi:hypothetical protein
LDQSFFIYSIRFRRINTMASPSALLDELPSPTPNPFDGPESNPANTDVEPDVPSHPFSEHEQNYSTDEEIDFNDLNDDLRPGDFTVRPDRIAEAHSQVRSEAQIQPLSSLQLRLKLDEAFDRVEQSVLEEYNHQPPPPEQSGFRTLEEAVEFSQKWANHFGYDVSKYKPTWTRGQLSSSNIRCSRGRNQRRRILKTALERVVLIVVLPGRTA